MIKVAKFGGSSVANAEQFKKIKHIVDQDPSIKVIVASACGKSGPNDHKVTDLLYLCLAHVKYGMGYEEYLQMIQSKHQSICDELNLSIDVNQEIEDLRELIAKKDNTDAVVSRGEYLACRLLAEYLQAEFIDARHVIRFRYDGSIDMDATTQALEPYLERTHRLVIPGFYGSLPNGVIKVMSRGGSDITGAILANVMNADVYENWTDVSGLLVTDPRIIPSPKRIERITYAELREMSYMGANVLHDEAIFPVKAKQIPINIRNTNDPDNPGTMILANCEEIDRKNPPQPITGITGRKGFTVITITKGNISNEVGFLRKALEIFEEYHLSIESVPVSVDSFSIIVQSSQIEKFLYPLVAELKERLNCEEVTISDHLSMIAIVGRAMKAKSGMSGRIFAEFGQQNINIRTINQGSDEISIIVGVDDHDFEHAIEAIYHAFIR